MCRAVDNAPRAYTVVAIAAIAFSRFHAGCIRRYAADADAAIR